MAKDNVQDDDLMRDMDDRNLENLQQDMSDADRDENMESDQAE